MGTVLYKDFVAFVSNQNFSFGSWSGNQLLKTVESFSSEVTFGTLIQNASDLPTTEGLVHDRNFVCPLPLSQNTVFDGPVYGNVGVRLWNLASDYGVTLKKVYVNIMKLNSSAAFSSLSGGDQLIWSGTITKTGGSYPSTPAEQTYIFPFWINIDDAEVGRNERVAIKIKLYGYAAQYYESPDRNRIYLSCNYNTNQTFFALPIVAGVD